MNEMLDDGTVLRILKRHMDDNLPASGLSTYSVSIDFCESISYALSVLFSPQSSLPVSPLPGWRRHLWRGLSGTLSLQCLSLPGSCQLEW